MPPYNIPAPTPAAILHAILRSDLSSSIITKTATIAVPTKTAFDDRSTGTPSNGHECKVSVGPDILINFVALPIII
jgi:hypothetical protein